jgi:hypothetical protein
LKVSLGQKIKGKPHLYEFSNPFMHRTMRDFVRSTIASVTKEENTDQDLVKAQKVIVVLRSTANYQNLQAIS